MTVRRSSTVAWTRVVMLEVTGRGWFPATLKVKPVGPASGLDGARQKESPEGCGPTKRGDGVTLEWVGRQWVGWLSLSITRTADEVRQRWTLGSLGTETLLSARRRELTAPEGV